MVALKMVQKRYAVNESRFPGKLAFANHLLVEVKHEPQLLDRTISNNRQIPKDTYEQIKERQVVLLMLISGKIEIY